ncbi:CFA53-like protein [Mya arenaria]|uniref:Cilia- and flagella-associated protein 53 n=1 Tax=Mya arenaria TaxID=6604 RepID=A0ABY7DMQ7_MYAAR|nr:cilia- and flagella-associated protein 53-like [Mya arenaria]WAQ98962.1 CFA53-like protein [Mya arenaria]
MMVSRRPRRTREVTGPTPCSVAIIARPPNKRPPEHLILERRKKEDMLAEYQKNTQYIGVNDLKNEWERWTDRKYKINTCKRKVDSMMKTNQFTIEDRRERLRQMLREEEAQYLAEMESKEETTIERQAKMRERARSLKDKREQERLAYVQDKYDQQFRNQCEELRSTLSKRQQDEVCVERLEQIRIKEEIEAERSQEEQMYARLWEEDMLAKAAREERDAKAAHQRNAEVLAVLRKQMAALEATKEEALRLKEEEAQLLREQNALRAAEEQRKREDKLRNQRQTREMLDHSLQLKMKKKARLEQEELAFDLKMLEQLLEESRNEAMEQVQRKRELREEDRRYRENLAQIYEEERIRERELEALIQQEVERMWQKRLAQWKLEREARKKLMQDVLAIRAQQVQARLVANHRKQEEAQVEREELQRMIEENRRHDEEEAARNREKHLNYQRDLAGQIEHNQANARDRFEREENEYYMGMQAEREYQQRLKTCLDNPYDEKMHPMRRAMAQKSA